jgi:putative cardiolipin synthase
MVARGVNVRVLTNSLASNDVAAAHAGWEKYRADLIRAGAEVYELRPDAGQVRQQWEIMGGRSIAALHTKALVIDRSSTFIGSFNLDPRSANINTEVGLLIDSPAFAAEAAEYLDEGVRPDNAYHVTLDDDGDLRWTAQVDGHTKVFDKEPETSGWKRFVADFIKVMPVESQL